MKNDGLMPRESSVECLLGQTGGASLLWLCNLNRSEP